MLKPSQAKMPWRRISFQFFCFITEKSNFEEIISNEFDHIFTSSNSHKTFKESKSGTFSCPEFRRPFPEVPMMLGYGMNNRQDRGTMALNKVTTTIKELPAEVAIEAIESLLSILERKNLRPAPELLDRIISNLFGCNDSVNLNSENVEVFTKCQERLLRLTMDQHTGNPSADALLTASCAASLIRKLELKDVWCTATGFQILKHTMSLQELALKYAHPGNRDEDVDVGNDQRCWATELEQQEDFTTWLPALTKLHIEALNGHKEFVRLIALIVQRGGLTNLEFGLRRDFEPKEKNLMLDFILEDNVVRPTLEPDDSIHDLALKILNWNRNSLSQIRFDPSFSAPDSLFNGNTAHDELCLDQNQGSKDPKGVDMIQSFCTWIYAKDFISETKTRMGQALQALGNLRALKLSFFSVNACDKIGLARKMERLPVQMILRNSATLTKISLQFPGSDLCTFTDDAFVNNGYAGVLSKCVSLQTLEMKVDDIFEYHRDEATEPKFRGIEKLPESLIYFSTTFPIFSYHQSLADLEALNLRNLETLCLSGKRWFTLQGAQVLKLDIIHLEQLKAKMPKLSTLTIHLGYQNPLQIEGTDKVEGYPFVSAELYQQFQTGQQFDGNKGTYLEIDMNQL